jgi:cell division protease FtsH
MRLFLLNVLYLYFVNSYNIQKFNYINIKKDYSPYSNYYNRYKKIINERNLTIQNQNENQNENQINNIYNNESRNNTRNITTIGIILPLFNGYLKYFDNNFENSEIFGNLTDDLNTSNRGYKRFNGYGNGYDAEDTDEPSDDNYYDITGRLLRTKRHNKKSQKSENFEVIAKSPLSFKDIGGYENIKLELEQCIDILVNYKKYENYNVRIPKGVILEGPPGNGKTLIAKGFAGETKTAFIPVSGSQFQEKYVGVGPQRIRELFDLAQRNTPCIIFIDEIDALGRKRSNDGEASSSERDSTLNELLINLDGFKTKPGIFLMGATNRVDLLDSALTRPGRIDKKIFIGPPDSQTREAIITIHLKGKPYDNNMNIKDLVDLTAGLSGAQIENLLNEAMLNALRHNRFYIEHKDLDTVINKIMVGWQPTEHQFTTDIIDRIAIHEMGHAIVGFLSKHHSKLSKVIINLSAPNSPGYTMFETSTSNIFTRESLFEHLMILLAGRIAEEIIYDVSVTTGALNDFEEALKLAEKMIVYYGMGKNIIYPNSSDKYKEIIDNEVSKLINEAYEISHIILKNSKELILECSEILKTEKILKIDDLTKIIDTKYPYIYSLKLSK